MGTAAQGQQGAETARTCQAANGSFLGACDGGISSQARKSIEVEYAKHVARTTLVFS